MNSHEEYQVVRKRQGCENANQYGSTPAFIFHASKKKAN